MRTWYTQLYLCYQLTLTDQWHGHGPKVRHARDWGQVTMIATPPPPTPPPTPLIDLDIDNNGSDLI